MKSSSCHVDASAARGGRAIPIRTEAPRLHVWLNICSSALQLFTNKWANKRGGRWNDQIFHFKAFVWLVLSFSSFLKCLGIGKSEICQLFQQWGTHNSFHKMDDKNKVTSSFCKGSLLSKPLKLCFCSSCSRLHTGMRHVCQILQFYYLCWSIKTQLLNDILK